MCFSVWATVSTFSELLSSRYLYMCLPAILDLCLICLTVWASVRLLGTILSNGHDLRCSCTAPQLFGVYSGVIFFFFQHAVYERLHIYLFKHNRTLPYF